MEKENTPDVSASDDHLKLYRDLVETSQDLIFQCDAEGRYTYLNPAWETTFGYTIDEMLGKRFTDFQTPEMAERDTEEYKRLMQGNMVKGFETVHLGKDGNEIHLVFNAKFILDDEGQIVGTRGTAHDFTQRKRIEEALQESEARYRFINNASHDQIYSYDLENRFTSVNRVLCENLKMSPDEIIGKSYWELGFPEENCRLWDELHREVYATGSKVQVVTTPMPDGTDHYFEVNLTLVKNDNEEIIGIAGVNRDITERKLAENALLTSEENLNTTARIAKVGGWEIDIKGNTLSWTEETFRIHERTIKYPPTVAEAIQYYHPDDQDRVAAAIQKALENDENFDFEAMLITEKQNQRWVRAIGATINRDGQLVGLRGIIQDISERKEAEKNIQKERNTAQRYLDIAAVMLAVLDDKGAITLINEKGCKILGYDEAEILNKNWFDLCIDEDIRDEMQNVYTQLMNGDIAPFEYYENPVVTKTGEKKLIAFHNAVIRDDDSNITGIMLSGEDITERKRMEEELQRTQKLESLGVLAGGIAHDFNNLMGGVFGNIDMAIEESMDNGAKLFLSKAMNAIDRARALTGQLLTFAKGGAPIQKIQKLFPFVEETVRFALSGSNVSCNFNVPQDLWVCNFDKNQIGQVIENLIINAKQAMPIGGTIELTARNIILSEKEHPTLKKDNYIKISVKDSGTGIQKEHISRVFDPFFSTKTKGHGLGLATCYSIINRHGGCIELESELGKGSTFNIYLPAATGPALSSTNSQVEIHIGAGTILVMDDEEMLLEIAESMLISFGYSVICKKNGKEAVDFFASDIKAKREIVGMIFDLTVPGGMGGKDAVAEIRKLSADVPVFVASGYAEDPIMKNPIEHGFTASICKPFRKAELSEMLSEHMKR